MTSLVQLPSAAWLETRAGDQRAGAFGEAAGIGLIGLAGVGIGEGGGHG